MSDKYDEAAGLIYFDDDGNGRTSRERIANILRSAFPSAPSIADSAEDAKELAHRIHVEDVTGDPFAILCEDETAIKIEAFARSRVKQRELEIFGHEGGMELSMFQREVASRVKPWREALQAFDAWWRLPNAERTIEAIEPAMRLCIEVISSSPAPSVAQDKSAQTGELAPRNMVLAQTRGGNWKWMTTDEAMPNPAGGYWIEKPESERSATT